MVKHLPTMQENQVYSLGREDLLEKEMATQSSILAWKIPWMEEPGRLQSMGLQRVGHDWVTSLSLFTFKEVFKRKILSFSLCDREIEAFSLTWLLATEARQNFRCQCWNGRKTLFCVTSLLVQWLRLRAFISGVMGSIPGGETKIPHALWYCQKKKFFNVKSCFS